LKSIVNWEILEDKESIDFKRFLKIQCRNCEAEHEVILDSVEKLKDIVCSCKDDEIKDRHLEYLDSNMGLDLKLSRIYKKLEKDKLLSKDFDNYFKFKKFCLDNGYKPWYVVDRKDKNKKYSFDNILITCGRIKKDMDLCFENVRKASNSLCLLENKSISLIQCINDYADLMDKFDNIDYVDRGNIDKIKNLSLELFKLSKELKKCIDILDIDFRK
jgi:hypothetical protein